MTNRIRILQILEATVGGTRKHLVSLVANLNRCKFDVEVACPRKRHGSNQDDTFVSEIMACGIPLHWVDMRRDISPVSDLRAFWSLLTLIRTRHYDIIHTHSSKAGFLGRLAGNVCHVPAVHTPHGFYFLDAKGKLRGKMYRQLERLAGLWTNKLIMLSESEKEVAVQELLVPDYKTIVIPNTVDALTIKPDSLLRTHYRHELNIPTNAIVVGTISRFIPQKDPSTFVRMARIILEESPQTIFVWCGEGPLQEQTKHLAAELQVHEAFRFVGFRPDAVRMLTTYDVFVLTSIFEGLPYSLLEAMATALPVVATNVTGTRDVVIPNQTGYLVPARDPLQLANCVNLFLHDPDLRRKFGTQARMEVIAKYNLREMMHKTENVYLELSRGRADT